VGALPAAPKRPLGSLTGGWPVCWFERLTLAAVNRPFDVLMAGLGILPFASGSGFTVTVTPDAACFAAAMTVAAGAGEAEDAAPMVTGPSAARAALSDDGAGLVPA
jgi:hypothetical protein